MRLKRKHIAMKQFLISFCLTFCIGITCSAQSVKFPLLEFTNAENLVITEISTPQGENYTKIAFELFSVEDQYITIPQGMYINNAEDQRFRYELIGVENNQFIPGEWYPLEKNKVYQYALLFEPIAESTNFINVYEPKIPNVEPWSWRKVHVRKMELEVNSSTSTTPTKPTNNKKVIGY